MRGNKKSIELDIDSALALMQEIYNDIVEQKNTASLITKKMLTFLKDAEDMPVIGSVIDKQQKILADCMDKKVALVKLQTSLLKQTGGGVKSEAGFDKHSKLSDEDRAIIDKLLEDRDDSKKPDNEIKYE